MYAFGRPLNFCKCSIRALPAMLTMASDLQLILASPRWRQLEEICDYVRYRAIVFDAWGFDRCLWGTDWTRAFAVVNYEQAVTPFRLTDRLSESERAMLMGGACAAAYGWSPKTG